jgi:hypothetical protein
VGFIVFAATGGALIRINLKMTRQENARLIGPGQVWGGSWKKVTARG